MTTLNFECRRSNHHPVRDLICHCHSTFKIQVINLRREKFTPNDLEVHFFGDDHGDELAFETLGYKHESLVFMLAAIQWYAGYLRYNNMKIYKHPPL